jgi:hypothetical protein
MRRFVQTCTPWHLIGLYGLGSLLIEGEDMAFCRLYIVKDRIAHHYMVDHLITP